MRMRCGALAVTGLLVVLLGGSAAPAPTADPADATRPSAAAAAAASPTVVCATESPSWTAVGADGSPVPVAVTLGCGQAVAAARALVGPDPSVVSIEFAFGRWCPPGAICSAARPNTGYVVFHRRVGLADLVVSVQSDASGNVSAEAAAPISSPSPS